MKRNSVLLLAILAMLFSALNFAQVAFAQQVQAEPKAVAPGVVSYQGYVTVNGSPYNGTGYFKFAVVDAAGTTTLWSNDGSASGGGEPAAGVPLAVGNGLFSVLLGDTSLPGMSVALSTAAFSVPYTLLRVWFSQIGEPGSFTQLAPDRRFSAVPYAFYSQIADDAN